MFRRFRPVPWRFVWPDLIAVSAVLATVGWALVHLYRSGYLPSPYFFDTHDNFMDWYNVAWWGWRPGIYEVWHAVYPPLSFVFTRIFSIHACYSDAFDAFSARDCDPIGLICEFGLWALNIFLCYKAFRRIDQRTAALRALALSFGLPMLYGLERGNLVIPTFTCFVLGHGKILKSGRLKLLAHALALNFKYYLILQIAPQAIRRRWRWLEQCCLLGLLIYLFTLAIIGGGTPQDLHSGATLLYATSPFTAWSAIYYATNYAPLLRFFQSPLFPVMYFVGSRPVEWAMFWLPLITKIGNFGVVLAFALAWFKPYATPTHRLAALATTLFLTATEPAGYTEIFLLFFVFYEQWRGPVRITMLICAYLLSLSWDLTIHEMYHQSSESWLMHRRVWQQYGIAAGELLRPALVLVIQYGLLALCAGDFLRAVKSRTDAVRSAAAAATLEGGLT